MAKFVRHERNFDKHEGIYLAIGQESGLLHTAFIHNTTRGPAAGGVRYVPYDGADSLFSDGLTQASTMTYKAALAGLWLGGGKFLIPFDKSVSRDVVFREHGQFVTSLNGSIFTASDMGVLPTDMAVVHQHTRYATTVPLTLGGNCSSGGLVGQGVVAAMHAALEWKGCGGIQDKSVAIMGAGKVAEGVLSAVLAKGAKRVIISDTDLQRITMLSNTYGDQPVEFRHVSPLDMTVLSEDVDVLSPCAFSGCLNPITIPSVKAKVIAGGANAPLLDRWRDAILLEKKGVLVVPDFIANRMGLVAADVESAGKMVNDPEIFKHCDIDQHDGIHQTTLRVLDKAKADGLTPTEAAIELAQSNMDQLHPIWPNRAIMIQRDLVLNGWCNN